MFVNKDNWEDCKKYYQGCWIKVREAGERIYLVREVGPHDTFLQSPARGVNDEDADLRIDMKVGYTIDYVIPKKTVFQHGENAIILERVPARMWKKGMDIKNTQFSQLSYKGTWTKTAVEISIIEGFVNKPSYYQFEDALGAFNGSLQSAALSPRISLTKEGQVFIDTVFVAKYSPTTKALRFKKIYEDNLVPLFPNTKCIPL